MAYDAGLPPLSQIFAMAFDGDTIFAGLYAKGLYTWSENKRRWTKARTSSHSCSLLPVVRSLWAITPAGSTEQKTENFRVDKSIRRFRIRCAGLGAASGDELVLAGMADGIFRSEDHGRTWSRILKGLPAKSPGVAFLRRGNAIYAGVVIISRSRK